MIEQKALVVNASNKSSEIAIIKDENIIGPMDYGLAQYKKGEDFIVLGQGLLAGSSIPGTHRLIVVGFSKQWEHFYDSTMGGACYVMLRLGINYIHVKGKADSPQVLKINRKEGKLNVEFVPIDVQKVWDGYANEKGFYALQKYIHDTYKSEFAVHRVIATGPSSMYTRAGALGSAPIEKGEITPVDCWAGRGGLGSQLVRNHNIVGIIYGGDEVVPHDNLKQREKIDAIFMEKFGQKMITEDMIATKKYRYDEDFHSGGTFGVNFTKIKGELFCFNYRSVKWTEEKRLEIHKRLIIDHYIKQFNEETIDTKHFKHCGEPCPAVCKKMNGIYKKDYEPYQTLGPNSGIFDQRAAELANHHADMIGIDGIQIGIFISWIMECLVEGVFPKEDFDLSKTPKWDPDNFDVVNDSMHNAELAVEIMNMIMYSDKGAVFRDGMRNAAKRLAAIYGQKAQNLAVYNAHGKEGCMVPNQYWTPGMYSPMPLMGKYCTSYGLRQADPKEIGKKNVERMVFELYSDNGGLCRFHRTWIETLLPILVNTLYGENIDYPAHHRKLAQDINLDNNAVFWETERMVDIIHGYLKYVAKDYPGGAEWLARFDADKWKAARAYWEELYAGQNEAFR